MMRRDTDKRQDNDTKNPVPPGMPQSEAPTWPARRIDRAGLEALFSTLRNRGYTLVGPRVVDQAIVYDEIHSTHDLPVGLTDEQGPGHYRVKPRHDAALFGYVVGPHSWKKYLFPPEQKLYSVTREGKALRFDESQSSPEKIALIGARGCELAAIAVQDRVFLGGPYVDRSYQVRRENLFVLAINCTEPGGACFCASMNTGPRASNGYDLALTEVVRGGASVFLTTVGSDLGREVLREIPSSEVDAGLRQSEAAAMEASAGRMGRRLNTEGLKELLVRRYEDKHWDDIAERCLSCANCTLVCPTCFCSTVEDVTDLSGDHAERWRKWDSCFNGDFSYIHGGEIRPSIRSRYRQWMVHKLSTWHDQFGTSGCVGCGRCITWCPVSIDITREAEILRERDAAAAATAVQGGSDERG